MKTVALSLLVVLFLGFDAQGQKKVKERDLKGQWKLVFDIDEDFIEEELEEEDIPWIGKIIAEGVTGVVFEILDEIDIKFEFQSDHRLKIIIDAFGEKEVEYARWYIDSRGGLVLDDDDHDDDVWLFEGDRLFSYEMDRGTLKRQPIFLTRIY